MISNVQTRGANLNSDSCFDHTKFSVQFQPWNCWRLCSGIDVGPPPFTLLQPEMPTDGVWTGQCDQPLKESSPLMMFLWRASTNDGVAIISYITPQTLRSLGYVKSPNIGLVRHVYLNALSFLGSCGSIGCTPRVFLAFYSGSPCPCIVFKDEIKHVPFVKNN